MVGQIREFTGPGDLHKKRWQMVGWVFACLPFRGGDRADRGIQYKRITNNSFPIHFFHAKDGIRDYRVTGVQTCALPIRRSSFFKQKTAYEIMCDWSSDVCSSDRSEEHTSELQSHDNLVCRLLLRSEEHPS